MKKRIPIQPAPRWLSAALAAASLLFCSKAPATICTPHITVTNTNDIGPGSLRDALTGVCAGGTIDFDTSGVFATPQTISILATNNPFIVNRSVNIVGPGADRLAVSGNEISRVFSIASLTTNSFSGFTITGGSVLLNTGSGIFLQNASLLLNACTLEDNYAGIGSDGAGIASILSSLVVSNSTVSDNASDYGGGIHVIGGTCLIINSTLSGNSATNGFGGPGYGGAIAVDAGGALTVDNSTISGNSAARGGGIYVGDATVSINNSIVDGNTSTNGVPNDVDGFAAATANFSLFGSPSSIVGFNNLFGLPIGAVLNTNLAMNGGPTETLALIPGGPAINAGDPAITNAPPFDQRGPGFPRIVGGRIDIGAFEFTTNRPPVAVCTNVFVSADPSNCTANASIDGGSYDPDTNDVITITQIPPGPYPLGTNTVTLLVVDSHGASNACSAVVSVEGCVANHPPVAVCTNVFVSADPSNCTANASIDGGSYDPDTNDVITITQIPPGPYPLGTNTVTLIVVDSHGASNACTAVVFVAGCVANHPPVAVCTNVTVSADSSNCTANVSINGGSYDPDTNDVITVKQIPPGPYPIGSNNVCLIVTDSHGASNVCCAVVTVLDTTPPDLSCPTSITQTNDPGQCSAVVSFVVFASDCGGILDLSCDIPSGSAFPVGTNFVTCSAADLALNTNTCVFAVIVQDTEPPLVGCRPAPNPSGKKIPVSGKNPSSGQNPDGYYQVLAKDNCDPNPRIYIHDLGSSFVAGPFNSGDIVKLKQNPGGTPTSAPGNPPIVAEIHLNGDAAAYAVDASGNISPNGCYMYIPPNPK